MECETYDVIVVGGGPAGLSAALVLGRARRTVLVFDDGRPRNAPAGEMHGFLSRDGTPPQTLLRIARDEILHYPSVEIVAERVIDICDDGDGFVVTTTSAARARGKRLLLTTGMFDDLPAVDGLAERWGRSVFTCPFCDGWEMQERRFAVYGAGREAVELAQELRGWTHDIVVCAQRDDLVARDRRWIDASGAALNVGRLQRITGPDASSIDALCFEDGTRITCDVLFISAPLRQHSSLFASLGCELTELQEIAIDACNQTSHRGCYAAGDAVTSVHQVIVAAASGVRAGIAITSNLLENDAEELTRIAIPMSPTRG